MSPISEARAPSFGAGPAPARSGLLVVRDASALDRHRLRGVRAVRLECAAIDAEEARRRESAINRSLRACGCQWAAAAGGLAAIGGAAWLIWRAGGPLAVPWPAWLIWFASVAAALGTGKAFGQWLARLKLRREIAALRQALKRRDGNFVLPGSPPPV